MRTIINLLGLAGLAMMSLPVAGVSRQGGGVHFSHSFSSLSPNHRMPRTNASSMNCKHYLSGHDGKMYFWIGSEAPQMRREVNIHSLPGLRP